MAEPCLDTNKKLREVLEAKWYEEIFVCNGATWYYSKVFREGHWLEAWDVWLLQQGAGGS